MDIPIDTIWHLYLLAQPEDLQKALQTFQVKVGKSPSKAKISVNCPPELEAKIRAALEPLGVTIQRTTYALPNDLWLTAAQGSQGSKEQRE